MIVDRKIDSYVIAEEASIQEAADKIARAKGRIVFCIDEFGRLTGSISNGDLIRWIAAGVERDGSAPATSIANHSVRYGRPTDSKEAIASLLSAVLFVPLVNDEMRITGIARRRESNEGIEISSRKISLSDPTLIVAEIGNNHNGSLNRAFELIRLAAKAGADCAKFQMRNMESLFGTHGGGSDNLGTEYVLDLLGRFQLSDDDLFRCFDLTSSLGMIPLCTAWDPASAERCKSYGLPAIKIASADLTNHLLVREVANLGLPIICSTGMSTEDEIGETARLLQSFGSSYLFLHCNSTYPAPFKDVNLRYLRRLSEIVQGVVGYSGHERDIFVAVAAVAMDARVIEKHFTSDRSQEGNDHKVSLLPQEFRRMVTGIREIEESLGTGSTRSITQGERANRVALGKSVFAKADINAGTILEESMIVVRSPGEGLQPNKLGELLGRPVGRLVRAGTPFYPSDLERGPQPSGRAESHQFDFARPWGIPVRHRDLDSLLLVSSPSFVEFHLSYRDLELDHAAAIRHKRNLGLVVHAPELFRGDHLLDLCSTDAAYRARSLEEMRRVIETAKRVSEFFDITEPVGIVTNVGGFSFERVLSEPERGIRRQILSESLSALRDPAVQIWPQTMPPFPWHLGGQRFHNLFVASSEIVELCRALGVRVCLDTSHSMLACNHLKSSFDHFLQEVAPLTAHVHMADARGVDGEGLQIGEGAIDFGTVFRILDSLAPGIGFIPEIWQGHENTGEGFWRALDRLIKARSVKSPLKVS
jgi:N-acetylneuraminate synthase